MFFASITFSLGCHRSKLLHAINCVIFSHRCYLEAAVVARLDYHVFAVAGLVEIPALISAKIASAYYYHSGKNWWCWFFNFFFDLQS